MPDQDDIHDPMDEAYLHAEQVLDHEEARAARRTRVLAAVAQEQAAAPASSARRPVRRYGGWLAAACVAGLSVWTAQQVYRSAPPPQPAAPLSAPLAAAPAPPVPSQPASPAGTVRAPAPRTPAARASAIAPPVGARPPIAPPPDIARPRPLPIPPVEKPMQASPAPPPAPIASPSVNVPAPAPPQAPAPVAAAKAAAEPGANTDLQSVVVTGSRIARRDYAASPQAMAQSLAEVADARSKMLDARSKALGARLRYDAAAGRIADIEPALAEGAQVDAADDDGETALMKSIQTAQSDVAALLRRHGASLDLKNSVGVSARDMAAAKNDPALNRALGLAP